jgi:hypothetical protein
MSPDQLQSFEKDMQAAVFRVMRQWIDKPSSIRRHHLVATLLSIARDQLQFFDDPPSYPHK